MSVSKIAKGVADAAKDIKPRIDRDKFYDSIRTDLFGIIKPLQLSGMETILDEWENSGHTDTRWLSYILATIYHETAKTMQPIKELGGEKYLKSKKYYPYYGRDFVQTTWKYNYEKVKKFTGVDVVSHPDLIANPEMAAKVAIEFMFRGHYTGKSLPMYFNDKKEDPINGRKIINGLDKAALVGTYYYKFKKALS